MQDTHRVIIQRVDLYIQNICQGTPKLFYEKYLSNICATNEIVLSVSEKFVTKSTYNPRVQCRPCTSLEQTTRRPSLTLLLYIKRQIKEDVLGIINLVLELRFR